MCKSSVSSHDFVFYQHINFYYLCGWLDINIAVLLVQFYILTVDTR